MVASMGKQKIPISVRTLPLLSSRGFTLTEAVVVIGLIGILAAVAVPNFIDFRSDAKIAITKDELAAIKRGIVGDGRVVSGGAYAFPGYEADMGAPPGSMTSLVTYAGTSLYDPIVRRGWRGPYVDTSTVSDYSTDAWGNAYIFSTSARHIRSRGPNGADNSGAGDDIQIDF
jgi:prepilin-type N-terminal cleavage/methylation domain-containing protein